MSEKIIPNITINSLNHLALSTNPSSQGEVEDDPGDCKSAEEGGVRQAKPIRDVVVRAALEDTVCEKLLRRCHDALVLTQREVLPGQNEGMTKERGDKEKAPGPVCGFKYRLRGQAHLVLGNCHLGRRIGKLIAGLLVDLM